VKPLNVRAETRNQDAEMMSGLRQIRRIGTLAAMTTIVILGPGSEIVSGQERDRTQTRLEESLPEGAVNRIREMSRELAEAGIPPQLIRRKALEGVAKGVPPDRIVTALEAYSGRLHEAKGLLGPEPNGASLAAAAEAVRRGVPPEAIRGLAREQGSRQGAGGLAVPLLVLGDLTEAGVPTDQAFGAVQEAMRRGAPEQGMMNLSAAVRRRVRQGEDPAAAFEQVRIRATERMRQAPNGSGQTMGGTPGSRPMDASPVPPGSEPPTRSGSGGRRQGPN
jgi:hypothetical protein